MGINFIKQFVSAGLNKDTVLIGPGFSGDSDIIQAVGDPIEGMFNTAQWAHDLDVPANKTFVDAFRQSYDGRYPSVYAAQAYDAIMAMDAAAAKVDGKVKDKKAVLEALKSADYESVRGKFTYGKNNFPIQPYYLRVVERDADGVLTNRLVGTIFDSYQDVYVDECQM